jgi:hypothetical protein
MISISLRSLRGISTFLAAITLTGALSCMTAGANEADARLALTRAEAKIEVVARSGVAPSTQSNAFVIAQQKVDAAKDAFRRDKNRFAEYYAMEAEVWAEVAASNNELAGLERTRGELARAVDILAVEINKQ